MPKKAISQREAARLRKQVQTLEGILERQRRAYAQEFFGGVNICTIQSPREADLIRMARKLGHAVVAMTSDNGSSDIWMMALPHPKVPVL